MSNWVEPKIRPTAGRSEWQTDCKLCRHGIFQSQAKVWLRSPMGYSHEDCARLRERENADEAAHRVADVAHQLAGKVRTGEEPEAVCRWVCGELDGLGRWQLLLMLAAMVDPAKSPAELLSWFWDRTRGAA